MRRLYFTFTLLMLLAVSSIPALGVGEVHLTYDFPNIVWRDMEKQGFAVFDRGAEIGEANVWIKEIEYFDQTAYMIEYIEESDGYKERTITKVSGFGLQPLASSKRIEIGEDVWFYEANYTSDQIELSYTTPENPYKQKKSMSGGITFYSGEVLPYMLRNLKFAVDDIYVFTLLSIDSVDTMHFQSAIVEVVGEEIIEVPSGVYDCWKVEIRQGGITYEVWYSKKQPQFLIKYYFGKELGMKNHT